MLVHERGSANIGASTRRPGLSSALVFLITFVAIAIGGGVGMLVRIDVPDAVVAAASLVYALLVSSALFLTVDMSQPFSGLMRYRASRGQHVLPPLGT
jgi:hypothetical protein